MMTRGQRRRLWALFAALFVFSAILSELLAPGHEEYVKAGLAESALDDRDSAGVHTRLAGTSFQTLLPTLLGVREVVASLMWVRADDFFHKGEYRPIINLVRQIVSIDPHQLDVYATGAWHMAYNFMDKRLIADGVQFLEEGCRNNDSVYDLWFELGYMHYDKTKDFPEAVRAYSESATRRTTSGKPEAPAYVRHQKAHALEKAGDIDSAIGQWRINVQKGIAEESKTGKAYGPSGPNTDAARHNLYITRRRLNERVAKLMERESDRDGALRLWAANLELARERLLESPGRTDVKKDQNAAELQVERLRSGRLVKTFPVDPKIAFTVTRLAPRRIQVEGSARVLDLSRIHVMFRDRDYDDRILRGFDFKMNECTLEWESPSIRKDRFRHVFDLNRDPADMGRPPADIYPLKADEYEIVVTYNPRLQAAFIQDVYGWNGEGLVGPPGVLKEDPSRAGILFGKRYPLRYLQKVVRLKREDVVGEGRKVLARG